MSELDTIPSSVAPKDDIKSGNMPEDKNSTHCFETPTEIASIKTSSVSQTVLPMMSQQCVIEGQDIHGEECSPATKETQICDGIHVSIPLNSQELMLDVPRCHTEKHVIAETKQECEETHLVTFIAQETRVGLIDNHKTEESPIISERTASQISDETRNTSDSPIHISNEGHTIQSVQSTGVKPKNFTEGTFCTNSGDLPLRFDLRNKFKTPHSTSSYNSSRRIKTPPLPMSRTSDIKEFLHIIFLMILGVLAFGAFYFLQAFKPKSNTAAAIGSVTGGVVLLMLFSCMYYIVKKDGLYCVQNFTPNV